jgi:hypothetical protein
MSSSDTDDSDISQSIGMRRRSLSSSPRPPPPPPPHPKVLAQIYKKIDDRHYETWDGERGEGIFACVRFDKEWVKRQVYSNCGDMLKKNIRFWDIGDFPLLDLTTTQKGYYGPTTIGNYLTLPRSSSHHGQPLALSECWRNVTDLLKKFMDKKKIYMFHPRSGVQIVATSHFVVPDRYKPSLWLDITDIKHELPNFYLDFFTTNPSFHEPIRRLDKSELDNTKLYEVLENYLPNPVKRSMIIGMGVKSLVETGEPPFKHQKLGGGQHAGKSRRRVKRRFKRKTIKRKFKKR